MIADILTLILIISAVAGLLLALDMGDRARMWAKEHWREVWLGVFRADRRLWKNAIYSERRRQ